MEDYTEQLAYGKQIEIWETSDAPEQGLCKWAIKEWDAYLGYYTIESSGKRWMTFDQALREARQCAYAIPDIAQAKREAEIEAEWANSNCPDCGLPNPICECD